MRPNYDLMCDLFEIHISSKCYENDIKNFGSNARMLADWDSFCEENGWTKNEFDQTCKKRIIAKHNNLPFEHIGN